MSALDDYVQNTGRSVKDWVGKPIKTMNIRITVHHKESFVSEECLDISSLRVNPITPMYGERFSNYVCLYVNENNKVTMPWQGSLEIEAI